MTRNWKFFELLELIVMKYSDSFVTWHLLILLELELVASLLSQFWWKVFLEKEEPAALLLAPTISYPALFLH